MKCPKCNGEGVITFSKTDKNGYFNDAFFVKECDECNGTGEVQTNEEWLRTLPADEQVKEVLSRGFMTEKRTAEDFVEWLKEKH